MTQVLLVTNIFPPIIGGPSTFVDGLAHALAARGEQVTVVCSSEGANEDDARRPFRVLRCDTRSRYRYELQVRAVLARELARHRRVLVNGLESYVEPIARRIGRRYVLKVVGDVVWETARNLGLTADTFDEFQNSPQRSGRLEALAAARSRQLALAATVVTPSRYLAGVVAAWGVPARRLLTIPNGVPVKPAAAPAGRARDEPLRVVFVGRLTNWKGVETAILALQQIEGVQLTVIGDGPEGPMLRELSRQLRLDGGRVRFLGRLPQEQVRSHVARAHALVLVSCYEGMSHTLLEAAQEAVPPIASDIGGNREVIADGRNGLLVPYGHVRALGAAFAQLRDDEPLRARLGSEARRTAASFSFDATTQHFAQLLCG